MDTVTILRNLWRLRLLVVGVLLVALLAGTAVVYKISLPPNLQSRRYDVGVATARILVDTPSSQVVEVAPKGSDTLGVRANLLASLMVDGVVKSAIAHRAGLQPNQLVGMTDATTEPSPVPPPPGPQTFVLKTQVLTNTTGENIPIIEIDAQAPDRAKAATLAAAAVSGLRDYLNSKAALQRVPGADRLQVTGLGAPQASTEVRGPSNVLAIVTVILVFAFGCACALGVVALSRGWRAASAREQLEDDRALVWADDDAPEEPVVEAVPDAPAATPAAATSDDEIADLWLAHRAFVVPRGADDEPQANSA